MDPENNEPEEQHMISSDEEPSGGSGSHAAGWVENFVRDVSDVVDAKLRMTLIPEFLQRIKELSDAFQEEYYRIERGIEEQMESELELQAQTWVLDESDFASMEDIKKFARAESAIVTAKVRMTMVPQLEQLNKNLLDALQEEIRRMKCAAGEMICTEIELQARNRVNRFHVRDLAQE